MYVDIETIHFKDMLKVNLTILKFLIVILILQMQIYQQKHMQPIKHASLYWTWTFLII